VVAVLDPVDGLLARAVQGLLGGGDVRFARLGELLGGSRGGRAGGQLREPLGVGGVPGAQLLDLGLQLVLGLEVAVVDVEVLGGAGPDRRGARADAPREVGGGEIALVERAEVVTERAHPGAGERGDDDEGQREGAEAQAEAAREWEILEALHGGAFAVRKERVRRGARRRFPLS
jgi:hypothetical protein